MTPTMRASAAESPQSTVLKEVSSSRVMQSPTSGEPKPRTPAATIAPPTATAPTAPATFLPVPDRRAGAGGPNGPGPPNGPGCPWGGNG